MNGTHEELDKFVSAITGKETIQKLTPEDLMTKLKQEDNLRVSMNKRSVKPDSRVILM